MESEYEHQHQTEFDREEDLNQAKLVKLDIADHIQVDHMDLASWTLSVDSQLESPSDFAYLAVQQLELAFVQALAA
ncbi:hypothetical protein [Bacillus sp. T3]|uniref:hypothetical protein n=1 Tax=Bacillus sp. T3 TaxID=467262 RepID=UPI0029810BD0|nr:hypothetical protein [Bacillus sp. T3]